MDNRYRPQHNPHIVKHPYIPINYINPEDYNVANFLREYTFTQGLPSSMSLTATNESNPPILTRRINPQDIKLKISIHSLQELETKIAGIQQVSPEMKRLDCIRRINTEEQIHAYHNNESPQISEHAIHAIIQRLILNNMPLSKEECLTEINYYIEHYCNISPNLISEEINAILNKYPKI